MAAKLKVKADMRYVFQRIDTNVLIKPASEIKNIKIFIPGRAGGGAKITRMMGC